MSTHRVCPMVYAGWMCLGSVSWTQRDGEWFSSCSRCGATGLAAVGERLALEAEQREGKS